MKKLATLCLAACLAAALATPAGALDYAIDAPEGPDYGKPTSVEVVHTADGGALKNEDISKNAALIPPGFGSASADTLNTGTWLTPNLAPEGMAVGAVNGSGTPIVFPPSVDTNSSTPATEEEQTTSLGYTPVTSDLYYSSGYLGTLRIPAIGLSVRVYEGTDSSTLMKGAGHFKGTSIWDGNCAIAGHNRGVRDDFGDLHTLERGDTITWTTKLGTRTYQVVSVEKVLETDTSDTASTTDNRITLFTCVRDKLGTRTYDVTSVEKVKETDTSGTAPSTENMLTLYTCVRNQRDYRWQVQAVEVV